MKNMSWGVVLGELGYSGFSTTDSPSVFTPGGGIYFDLLDEKDIRLGLNGDISFPTFQNIRLNIGGDLKFFDFAGIRFSSTADLRELAGIDDGVSDPSALVPSFGIYFNFKTNFADEDLSKRGWSQNDIKASVSASPMENGLWGVSGGLNVELGVIDKTAPEIELDLSEFLDQSADAGNDEGDEETKDVSFIYKGKTDGGKRFVKAASTKKKIYTADTSGKNSLSKNNPGNLDKGAGRGTDNKVYISK